MDVPENLHEIFEIENIGYETFRLNLKPEYSRFKLEYQMRGTRRIGEERLNDMINFIDFQSGTYFYSYTDSENIKSCIMYMFLFFEEDNERNTVISMICRLENETVYCEMTHNIV